MNERAPILEAMEGKPNVLPEAHLPKVHMPGGNSLVAASLSGLVLAGGLAGAEKAKGAFSTVGTLLECKDFNGDGISEVRATFHFNDEANRIPLERSGQVPMPWEFIWKGVKPPTPYPGLDPNDTLVASGSLSDLVVPSNPSGITAEPVYQDGVSNYFGIVKYIIPAPNKADIVDEFGSFVAEFTLNNYQEDNGSVGGIAILICPDPVEPPVEPPIDPPVDPPIEPPVEPPVKPPVDPPVQPPVSEPSVFELNIKDPSDKQLKAQLANSKVKLTATQLLINQRISQAAILRHRANQYYFEGKQYVAPSKKAKPAKVTPTLGQLKINRKIATASYVRTEEMVAQIEGRAPKPVPVPLRAKVKFNSEAEVITQALSAAAIRRMNAVTALRNSHLNLRELVRVS